jgi:hypothetical protein
MPERLLLMKVSNAPETNPYIAVVSKKIGEELISGRRLEGHCHLLPQTKLTLAEREKIQKAGLLLFERIEQVAEYLEKGENFDFSTLTISHHDADQRNPLGR